MTARLALGTAQFGMNYGIANRAGQPDLHAICAMLEQARAGGIDMLDTAIAYGEAERVLGEAGIAGWRVVTKLPAIPDGCGDIDGWMEEQAVLSLARMKLERLHGVLLHAPTQLHTTRAKPIVHALEKVRDSGIATRVGVSIQHPERDLPVMLALMSPGIVQSPLNPLDDTLVAKGWAARLETDGCEVHTRSSFLQGLLLMEPDERPAWTRKWAAFWQVWDDWLASTGLPRFEACLRYARGQGSIDRVVIGVDSVEQLAAALAVRDAPLDSPPQWPGEPPIELIDPSKWPRA